MTEDEVRAIARSEVASMAGLILRRLQDEGPTRSIERNWIVDILSGLFGEVLHDFGGTQNEPGDDA